MEDTSNLFQGDLNGRWRVVTEAGHEGELPAFAARARREGTRFFRVREVGPGGEAGATRAYVLKALPVADAAEREQMERAVRTRNRFRQDNVLPVVDWFDAGGYFCTVTEEMAGDLATLVLERGKDLALAERCRIAARLGEQLALALMALHRPTDGKPPVHLGALEPRDILLSADPTAEPLFVAYLHGLGRAEQAQAENATADDVYALGALLHEVLTGEKPSAGTNIRLAPGYEWLARLTRDMLAADPSLRPTARQVLAAFLQQPPVAARPTAGTANEDAASGAGKRQGETWRAIPAAALTLGAAVLLLGLLAWLSRGRRTRYITVAARGVPASYRQATFASLRAGMRR